MNPTAWTPAPLAVALLLVLAVHERGARRLEPNLDGRPAPRRRREAALFRSGIALGAVLLASPLGRIAEDQLFARALIDFALAWVVAPVIILGAPWNALQVGLGRRAAGGARRRQAGAVSGDRTWPSGPVPGAPRRAGIPARPITGVSALLLSFWLWHIPVLLDATVTHESVRLLEEVSVLAGGLLWWSEIVGSHPYTPSLRHIGRSALVAAVFVGYWGLAAAMVYSPTSWYPAFDRGAHAVLSPALSQEFAGAFMWALPSLPLGIVALWCFSTWLGGEDVDEQRIGEIFAGPRLEERAP